MLTVEQIRSEVPVADKRSIPRSLEEADEADTLLWELAQRNTPWKDIRAAVETLTGEKVGGVSSLPNRYEYVV